MTTASYVEFLLWLLIAASIISVIARRLGVPYTVALVFGGLLLSFVPFQFATPLHPGYRPHWLTADVILTLFLPALLFEGSLRIEIRRLKRDLLPILLLANIGVVIATFVTGAVMHYAVGLPLLVALLFGAIVAATDPISVLAIFKELAVSERLSVLLESESLLNDGTAVVLFQILLAAVLGGSLGIVRGAGEYVLSVIGGLALGAALGFVLTHVTKQIDDPQVEITLTTILAYGAFLTAHALHVSGVLATVAAGLYTGNVATKTGMSARTLTALQSFWEYAAFIINSLVFLLIGLEVRWSALLHSWKFILVAIAAVLAGRVLAVWGLVPLSNCFSWARISSGRVPGIWRDVLVWGGLRGALSLALALSLDGSVPYRDTILNVTFGVVIFSILAQGLTLKPLLHALDVTPDQVSETSEPSAELSSLRK